MKTATTDNATERATHTPGPWFYQDCGSHGTEIGHTFTPNGGIQIMARIANKADARLCAAAPDLLSILKKIITANDAPSGGTMGEARLCEAYAIEARAAIARATA